MSIKSTFLLILEAGGQDAGKLELAKIDRDTAREYIQKQLDKQGEGETVDDFLPFFESNFQIAKQKVHLGKTKRKDMPVITDKNIKAFQHRLNKGFIDITNPFSPDTNPNDPFPEGLSKNSGEEWLKNGLRDRAKSDDIVKVRTVHVKAKDLNPIQKQIYFDKSMKDAVKFGIWASKKFLSTSYLIKSKDNFIIDGHHRWMSCILIDPDMSVTTLEIDLPISKLLPMALSYGDAIGNKRNK